MPREGLASHLLGAVVSGLAKTHLSVRSSLLREEGAGLGYPGYQRHPAPPTTPHCGWWGCATCYVEGKARRKTAPDRKVREHKLWSAISPYNLVNRTEQNQAKHFPAAVSLISFQNLATLTTTAITGFHHKRAIVFLKWEILAHQELKSLRAGRGLEYHYHVVCRFSKSFWLKPTAKTAFFIGN